MNILKDFPGKEELLKNYNSPGIYEINGHIHTPFSFSAFQSIGQAIELAVSENVKALGINDFIVTDGYEEFARSAFQSRVFPLFNIEFMGLDKDLQKQEIRVNDPNNPGRIYFSGKGLRHPVTGQNGALKTLKKVQDESNAQTRLMTEKLNHHLASIGAPFRLSFEEVKKQFAKELVRERHLAQALRVRIFEVYETAPGRSAFMEKLYNGKPSNNLDNVSALDNEIRSMLLKKGGVAFIEEDENAFLDLDSMIKTIVSLGGIPCYPVLLDDAKGAFTEFESDYERMADYLSGKNIYSVELIPGRNNIDKLREFVRFFNERNFVISFGTEHNTPELTPLKVDCRNQRPLDDELKRINYEGACAIAAHQYLMAKGEEGFIDAEGKAKIEDKEYFVKLGNSVLNYFLSK